MFENWFLILRKEYSLRSFNNSVLRKLNCDRNVVIHSGRVIDQILRHISLNVLFAIDIPMR